MTDFTLTQDALVDAHKQGHRFVLRIEAGGASAGEHAMRWLEWHNAWSVAAYRILPNGTKNFIRFYDYRDLEGAA